LAIWLCLRPQSSLSRSTSLIRRMATFGAGIRHPFSQKIGEDARYSCPCATIATPITGRRFGNVIGRFAIVITHFGHRDRSFRKFSKVDHVRPKQPITFRRNDRSRSTEMARHVTIVGNTQTPQGTPEGDTSGCHSGIPLRRTPAASLEPRGGAVGSRLTTLDFPYDSLCWSASIHAGCGGGT
jgi:hypothetical protein